MNELTAAVALAQLRKVENVVKVMNRLGNLLTSLIGDIEGLSLPRDSRRRVFLLALRLSGHRLRPAGIHQGPPGRGDSNVLGLHGHADLSLHGRAGQEKTFGSTSYPIRFTLLQGLGRIRGRTLSGGRAGTPRDRDAQVSTRTGRRRISATSLAPSAKWPAACPKSGNGRDHAVCGGSAARIPARHRLGRRNGNQGHRCIR